MRFAPHALTFALALALTACTGPAPAPAPGGDAPAGDTKADAGGAASQPTADPHAGHADMADAGAFKPLTGAKVMFGEPADGAEVTSPVKVVMQVEGATVKPAGVPEAGTGHHHIIVDGGPMEAEQAVPKDGTHIHYGDGSTEAELTLEPGQHTLTMQFADGLHRSYGPELSTTITITVKE